MKSTINLIALSIFFAFSNHTYPKGWEPPKIIEGKQKGPCLEVTYIGNEGVLIASEGKKIIIDGLHRDSPYEVAYAHLPPDQLQKLEAAQTPFDRIDLILVTHIHLDHFHVQSAGSHLLRNGRAVLISSNQVVDSLKKDFGRYRDIQRRIKGVTPGWRESVKERAAGIDLEILGMRHAGQQFQSIQNLGYIVTLGGKRLLHIGDADMSVENFKDFKLHEARIDVAFIPYWYLTNRVGRSIVIGNINPKSIIAVHIPPSEAEDISKQIRDFFPVAIALTRLMQRKQYC